MGEDKEPEIRITKEDPDKKGSKGKSIVLQIEGETVEVQPKIAIGWRDILEAEANNPARVDIKVSVSSSDPVELHHAILSNLREDIDRRREGGETDRQIYRDLIIRYHPDIYHGEEGGVMELAKEYTQALVHLEEIDEIKRR